MYMTVLQSPNAREEGRRVDSLANELAHRIARRAAVELGLAMMGANDAGQLNGLEVIDVNIAATLAAARRLTASAIATARGTDHPLTGDDLQEIDLSLRAGQILLLQGLTPTATTPEPRPAA